MPADLKIAAVFTVVDKSTRAIGKIQNRIMVMTAKVSTAMRRLDRAMSHVTRGVTRGLKYGFTAAAGVAVGLYAALNKTAEGMDKLAKKSRSINFPIEDFQEWQFVAEQSGVSADIFDKSLQKMTKNIGDLKTGTGSLYTTLKKSDRGLLRQLKSTEDSSEAFDLVIASIQKIDDPMKKASLATAAFGRAGIDMVNMANLGSEEIEKLRKQMQENGVVTADQAAQAEAYNDMMNRLKRTMGGFLVGVLTPLMPIVTGLANGFREWAIANRDLISEKLKTGLRWIVDNFQLIVKWGKRIATGIAVFYGFSMAIKAVNIVMTVLNALAAANPILLIVAATAAATAAIIVYRKELIKFTVNAIERMKSAMGEASVAMRKFFEDPIPYIIKAVTYLKDTVVGILKGTAEFFWTIGKTAWSAIGETFGLLGDLLVGNWEGAEQRIIGVWTRIKDAAASVMASIKEFLQPILDAIGFVIGWHDKTGLEHTSAGGVKSASLSGGAKQISAGVVPNVVRPSVSLSKSETSHREDVNVRISDETKGGRAKMTGKSKRVNLVRTGAMP